MADDTSTATAEEKQTDESAPEDPAMAAFLEDKKAKEAGKSTDDTKSDDKSDDDKSGAATSDETDKDKKTDDGPQDDSDKKDASADDTTDAGDSKADDGSTAKTEQNRLGYQLRQIRGNDPFVARARKSLTDEYVNAEGISDEQREIRQMKADNYIEKLERQRAQLVSDSQTIAEEFPFFNPADKENFKKDLYDRAMARFGRDSLEMSDPDEQGKQEIIGYKTRLLDYLREEADLIMAGRSQGQSKTASSDDAKKDKSTDKSDSQKKSDAEAKMDAASEDVGGASTTKADSAEEEDPIVRDFLAGMDSVK